MAELLAEPGVGVIAELGCPLKGTTLVVRNCVARFRESGSCTKSLSSFKLFRIEFCSNVSHVSRAKSFAVCSEFLSASNSLICHSYANTAGVPKLFPFWNQHPSFFHLLQKE